MRAAAAPAAAHDRAKHPPLRRRCHPGEHRRSRSVRKRANRSLPGLIAKPRRTIDGHPTAATTRGAGDVELNQTITEACRAAVGSMVRAVTGSDGRSISRVAFGCSSPCWSASAMKRPQPLAELLPSSAFAGVDPLSSTKLFRTCASASSRLRRNGDGELPCGPSMAIRESRVRR